MLNSYSLIQNQLFSEVLKAKEGKKIAKHILGNSLEVKWLGLLASTARDMGLIPGGETRSHMFQSAEKQNK